MFNLRNPQQFTRAGVVLCVLLLSGTLSAAVSAHTAIEQVRAEDRRMLLGMLTSGRNSIAIGKNDTLGIAYAIPTDTILGVTQDGTNRIYCRGKDGLSSFRVRLYARHAPNPPTPIGAIVGDTMVIGCGAWGDTTKMPPPPVVQPSDTSRMTPISCNPFSTPTPSCADTTHSIPAWRTNPCAWIQNSDTTIACVPLPPPLSSATHHGD